MQTFGGAPAAAAIETTGTKRYFRWELLVDWDRDGSFSHPYSDISSLMTEVALDRQLSGSAPSELMLVEGHAAAELTLTLEGEIDGIDVVTLFSEFNGNSPLYAVDQAGCEITYRIGVDTSVGTIWYPQFVGNIRNPAVKRSRDAQITITALDYSEKMRQPVHVPVWAMTSWHSIRGYVKAQLCSSHWVIDQCLRTADASVTPYRPVTPAEAAALDADGLWGMQLWVSGNSSYIPNIGTVDNARVLGFPKTEVGGAAMYIHLGEAHPLVKAEVEASGRRPYNLSPTTTDATGVVPALQAADSTDRLKSFYLAYRGARPDELQDNENGMHMIGFRLITRGDGGFYQTANIAHMEIYVGHLYLARIRFNAGQVRAELWRWDTNTMVGSSAYVNIPTGRDSVQIDAQFSTLFSSVRRQCAIRADENVSAYADLGAYTGALDYDTRQGIAAIRHQVAMQDIYWVNRSFGLGDFVTSRFDHYARVPAQYAGVLDEGLNKLTLMPKATYDDAWELASSVADAEMGAIFWDEKGTFRFWNRDTIAGLQAITVRTLDMSDITADLSLANSLDSIRNIVSAEALLATSDQAMIFDSSNNEEFFVPGGATVVRQVPASDDVMSANPGFVTRYATTTAGGFPAWNDKVQHGYVVQWYVSGTWQEMDGRTSGVDVLAYSDGQGDTTLRFHNGYGEAARFSNNAGDATLRVLGTTVSRSDSVITEWRDDPSVLKYGPRNLPLQGDWVQDQPTSIDRLGEFVLARTVNPIPVVDQVEIAGDPRLQMGDCLSIKDPEGLGEELKLQVLGVKRVLSKKDGLTDNLSVELIRPSLVGLWDSEQYGRWDTTFIWS